MTSPEADIIAVVARSQRQSQSRRRNNCTPHTQLSPEPKRRRAVTSSNSAMANGEPHGFVFDHAGRRPASVLSRQRRVKSSATVDARSSLRLPSLRSALFSGTKNRQQNARETSHKNGSGASIDKTPTSGVFRSLFGRHGDNKSPPSGDLWIDVDPNRSASPPLDDLSVTSADWIAAETAAACRRPEVDLSATVGEGHVAIVKRSNSARPPMRRPLPMHVPSTRRQSESLVETPGNVPYMTTEQVRAGDTADLWTCNNARLSGDSGHVSYCSDEQELSRLACQEGTTQRLYSADSCDWQRSMAGLSNEEMRMRNPDHAVSCSISNSMSVSDGQQSSRLPLPPYHCHAAPAATDMRQDSPHHVMSWSTSDVQAVVDPQSRGICPSQPAPPPPPVQEWSQSLTRGSTRTADERLLMWPSSATMASSMPSIPRECGPGGDTCQTAAEPTTSTKEWLDALHSRSTDQMYALSFNPAGSPHSPGAGLGLLGQHSSCTPSGSTLAGSDESFAVTEASSRHSLNSRDFFSSQNQRNYSSSSKKRHVRFDVQPTTVQGVPDQRQRSRSRSDKRQKTVGNQASGTDRSVTADDDVEGRTTPRASGSFLSKFRRVVDGVGALFGLAKQKNNVEEPDAQPTCNGHMPASSFDDMTELERLATVADRVASERLHSAVLRGKLPTQNGYRSGCRAFSRSEPSFSDTELKNVEASFAGLNISSVRAQPEHPATRQQQDLASWCGGNSSSSVSEELCRLPSNACSSYVQFVPKSMTVPCSIGSTSDVVPPSSGRKPSASSSMGNVVLIECQCGNWPTSESGPVLPTTNSSRVTDTQRCGPYNRQNRCVLANFHPYAEPSSVLKSVPQPATLNSQGQMWQSSSVTDAAEQNVELRRSTSDTLRVREKPQPPPKVLLRSSTTPFREGLIPTPAGVEDFRIRRQVGSTNHGPQSGPMKATVPFVKQPNSPDTHMSHADATGMPLPPAPPPTRNFVSADICGLSTESDTEAQRLTLQELSALVDKELEANEQLEMSSDVVETRQPLDVTAVCSTSFSNQVDSFRVVSCSTCSRKPDVQSKDDVNAQLKSLGFDEAIWNLELDEILGGPPVGDRKLGVSDDEEDSASTLTDCSGSVVTLTTMQENRPSTSSFLSANDQLQPSNDVVDVASGCGSVESVRSIDNPFSWSSKLSTLGSGSSYSLPAISDVLQPRPGDTDPAHSRCSSTNIPVTRTCREDVRGQWRLPVGYSFNQLTSGTTATAVRSPYNSKSSGIGSLIDSGSVPNSPVHPGI